MARTSRKPGNPLRGYLDAIRQEEEKAAGQLKTPAVEAGLYVRLSNEDNGSKSADGIDNQLGLLLEFVKQFEKVRIVETYMDNGQTGTDFERPGWKRMIEDAKRGRINCMIVKDLSRFARNYLEAGDYLEKIFPFLGVRFIAVNDRFDSAGEIFPKKEWITEFKNLANDYYSKDISNKIMSALQVKKEQGQCTGGKAPYGYVLKNNHYVIDEPAADVVRRIFEMKTEGISAYKIARILNQDGIPSPSRYAGEQGVKKYKDCGHILWQQEAVSRILYNRAYTGDLVQGKYNRSIYSRERRGKKEESAWEIIENAHPAIIDRDAFQKIQEIREKNRKAWKDRQGGPGYGNVLEGILVCGICHHAMWRNKEVGNGKVRYYFYCGSAYGHSQTKCNTSSIADHKIFAMVLKQIKLQIELAVEADSLLERMKKSASQPAVYRMKRKETEQARDELKRYVYLKTSIYEDMKQGILTKDEYLAAKERYTRKISELETELNDKQDELNNFKQYMGEENRWLKAFLKFRDAKELTKDMAVHLLEKVEVYENKRIHIRFRFRNEYEYLMNQLARGEDCGREISG
ncbi:MAG: recombinase family protein [Eubacterium sp.]|nr:recombinase family protein [Eubacterium sp.]